MFVCCLYVVLCRYRPLRRADHPSRGVLPCVCTCVIKKPRKGRSKVNSVILAPVNECVLMRRAHYDVPCHVTSAYSCHIICSRSKHFGPACSLDVTKSDWTIVIKILSFIDIYWKACIVNKQQTESNLRWLDLKSKIKK
jgi:hypothetical protein